MLDMHDHYGLTREPFTKNLTLEMLHHHHGHDEAAARITWCIREGAIGVITGEAGAGKTAAARAAIGGIDRTRHHTIYIANPTTGVRGLWFAIVAATGGKPVMHTAALAAQAEHALAAEAGERGRRPVLIVDEAHLLDTNQLEILRMMTLCRDRDYAGDRQGSPGGRSHACQVSGIIPGPQGKRGACPAAGTCPSSSSATRSGPGPSP